MKNLIRQDDTMIAVETVPATVDFDDILSAIQVVHDDFAFDPPWENCDGFEHTTGPVSSYYWEHDLRDARGCCYCDSMRECIVIKLTDDDWGLYDWHRKQGATRQVAREAVAAERRRTLNQLVSWYENGWEWWGVKCDFEILGKVFESSVWGIDNSEFAEKEVVFEIADEIAAQLERAGFTVINKPESRPYPTRADRQNRLHRNLNLQNWKD